MIKLISKRNFAKKVSVIPENRYIYLTPDDHKSSLIFLHGLGDTAMGFYDLFLDPKNRFKLVPPTCRVVLPTAPIAPVSLNDGYEMNSWFNIFQVRGELNQISDLYDKYDQKSMLKSVDVVTELIDQEVEILGGKSENVYIGGFSQGCALSLATFLKYPKKLGAVIGLSGMLALDIKKEEIDLELKKQTPIFLYHGERDNMIDVESAKMSYGLLDKYGLKYSLTTEKGLEHSISLDEIEKLSKFINNL